MNQATKPQALYGTTDSRSRPVFLRFDREKNEWQMNRCVQAAIARSWDFSLTGWGPVNPPDMMAHGLPVYNGHTYQALPGDLDIDQVVKDLNRTDRLSPKR
jgi:hypothetical protein